MNTINHHYIINIKRHNTRRDVSARKVLIVEFNLAIANKAVYIPLNVQPMWAIGSKFIYSACFTPGYMANYIAAPLVWRKGLNSYNLHLRWVLSMFDWKMPRQTKFRKPFFNICKTFLYSNM